MSYHADRVSNGSWKVAQGRKGGRKRIDNFLDVLELLGELCEDYIMRLAAFLDEFFHIFLVSAHPSSK